jgi:transcriptional regulator with XRE-family HTH domain
MKSFGQRVKDLREALGMTQEQLAKAISRSQKAVSLIERGDRPTPSSKTLQALADVFDVIPTWLLTGEGEMKPHSALSAQENELLLLYRALSTPGKAYLMSRLQDIYKGEYEKSPSPRSPSPGDHEREPKDTKRFN